MIWTARQRPSRLGLVPNKPGRPPAGVAALLLERRPRLTPEQIAAALLRTARAVGPGEAGTVDACAALAAVADGIDCS